MKTSPPPPATVHEQAPALTTNQILVLEALDATNRALGAYDLLDALRDRGLRAPAQIYRALDKLVGLGLVHKVESRNAYVRCRADHDVPPRQPEATQSCPADHASMHPDPQGVESNTTLTPQSAPGVGLMICERCDNILEVTLQETPTLSLPNPETAAFEIRSLSLEIKGICATCRAEAVQDT